MNAARTLAVPLALLAALAAGPAAPGPAAAADRAPGAVPRAADHLQLSVSGSERTWWRGVELDCRPPGGRHPRAARACAAIERARGDFGALRGRAGMCTAVHDPVTAAATGTWRGRRIEWRRTYGNACELESATGPVFRF
ncbi:hypothetical protein GCM10010406_21870 [Streptomyces thermolineatus]|uniref:Subtilisin inhibitor domain-containing protein n=1 Tax=Streptomyces thermolineatus TaxID=44033 RepID=A0ABN3LLC9_9ACTN